MDFKPVCKECIYEKLSGEESHRCPVCNIDLGRLPLDKLRRDHNLQDIRAKIFPPKRKKIDAPDAAAMVSRIGALEVDVAAKVSRVTELETELANVRGELANLKGEKEVMSDKLNAVHMQLGQKEEEILALQANKQALEPQLTELKKQGEEFVAHRQEERRTVQDKLNLVFTTQVKVVSAACFRFGWNQRGLSQGERQYTPDSFDKAKEVDIGNYDMRRYTDRLRDRIIIDYSKDGQEEGSGDEQEEHQPFYHITIDYEDEPEEKSGDEQEEDDDAEPEVADDLLEAEMAEAEDLPKADNANPEHDDVVGHELNEEAIMPVDTEAKDPENLAQAQVGTRIFPRKKRKIADPKFAPSVSFPIEREDVTSPSLSLPPIIEPSQTNNHSDQCVHDQICDTIKWAITEAADHIARMAGAALNSSHVFCYNLLVLQVLSRSLFTGCSDSKEAFKSIPTVLNSALHSLRLIRSGIPLLDAEDVQKNFLFYSIDLVIGGLQVYFSVFRVSSLFFQEDQLLSEALKQLEENLGVVATLQGIAEQAQVKQAQAESTLREMQMKNKTVADAVKEARKEIWESLGKKFQDILNTM
ncbi:Zinc finger, RING/FYVE/PHD-type [Trema orientale]|uniref:Zinc finger, RING/FYVE/PHD-type n=1 Tax=Trema orientale TaxID=63057 RepID=A0A2P5ENR8_TREOI|nr:Zinc finger, RING/FYVE/PHD-type [Trema orientale]